MYLQLHKFTIYSYKLQKLQLIFFMISFPNPLKNTLINYTKLMDLHKWSGMAEFKFHPLPRREHHHTATPMPCKSVLCGRQFDKV